MDRRPPRNLVLRYDARVRQGLLNDLRHLLKLSKLG